ncbi:hypothetical protein JEZ13_04190 [bacterium]|nr:hypothetical protein [bacterium]MBI9072941.1 hypothetical protein [Melioribacteraceae bacterium]
MSFKKLSTLTKTDVQKYNLVTKENKRRREFGISFDNLQDEIIADNAKLVDIYKNIIDDDKFSIEAIIKSEYRIEKAREMQGNIKALYKVLFSEDMPNAEISKTSNVLDELLAVIDVSETK